MIAKGVTFARHSIQQARLSLGSFSDDEERRGHLVLAQHVENCGGIGSVWTVIECQRDDAMSRWNPGERLAEKLALRILDAFVCQKGCARRGDRARGDC